MKEALVRYSDKKVGGYNGQVRVPQEKDDKGQVTLWRVYPMRYWSDGRREMWLSLEEARLWHGMRDWSIVSTRDVQRESEGDGQMEEALVEYTGRMRAKFRQRVGSFPVREWARTVPGYQQRWLPVEEAQLWDGQRDWRIRETRVTEDAVVAPVEELARPAPPAVHIGTVVEDALAQTAKVVAEREQEEAEFCLSDAGIVHKQGCIRWPKYPLKMYDTFVEAINDEDSKRAHRLCCKAELTLQEAREDYESELEKVDDALAQMGALGESYGIQAKEA